MAASPALVRWVKRPRQSVESVIRKKWTAAPLLALSILPAAIVVGVAGDSLYGTVTEVKSAAVVVFDYDSGRYDVRIIGIDAPSEARLANEAAQFVSRLVLGKRARIRFDHRAANGEMVSRLFTADSAAGIRDVGVELVRAGLARRQAEYDYKYGELSAAENEARQARRGLWAAPR